MKKPALLIAGLFALIGVRVYIAQHKPEPVTPTVVVPAESPVPLTAEEEKHGAISDYVAGKLLKKAGTSWEEVQGWVVKVRNIFNNFKGPEVSRQPEIQPVSQYKAAYNSAKESGKPLIVLITADWCERCHKLERDSIAPLRANGELDDCEYIVLDLDQDKEAKAIVGNGNLPVLMRYQFTNGKWQSKRLDGHKPKSDVLRFLKGSK